MSLFRKRKKPDLRSLVKQDNNKRFRKVLKVIFILFLTFFLIAISLFLLKIYLLPLYLEKNENIILPQDKLIIDEEFIAQVFGNEGIEADNIKISPDRTELRIQVNGSTQVVMKIDGFIKEKAKLIKQILKSLSIDNKQANFIDLRYNKPIVKF